MEQSSIVIHKGGREDKYQIYVEDYVLSFLKGEIGTLELSEFYFYGFKEKSGRKYMIYGAGRNRDLAVFDKYNLLEEIGCRLTQAGPVFLIREENNTEYEIKGYEVFYQDNREMQNYLIDRKQDDARQTRSERAEWTDGATDKDAYMHRTKKRTAAKRTPHNAITVQLGVILITLVAIVINSSNSYDKLQELNQSAEEVLFAMENQEAEDVMLSEDEKEEIVVERGVTEEEDILKLATLENEGQTGTQNEENAETQTGDESEGDSLGRTENQKEETLRPGTEEKNEEQDESDTEKVEALSRNVTRYYEVERGDTLYTISQKIYGDTAYVKKICELNQITDPDNIRYGQKIILP